jgi:glutamyl-Q tRNA(Asp) synthetase
MNNQVNDSYIGRFAPSPSGALHFGSLVAALGSYLDARSNGGQWFVRMEDLDPPREKAGAADDILRTLEAFGLEWDGPVMYQSRRQEAYREALEELRRADRIYSCYCSRKEIASAGQNGIEGIVYPGTCRSLHSRSHAAHSQRLITEYEAVAFHDRVFGELRQHVESEIGDFILHRTDGYFAYQLAVVVDDAEQGITQIVRGADLLLSTPRQILLQVLLELPTPQYAHLPLVTDDQGRKLSKQSLDLPVDRLSPLPALLKAYAFLGQKAPDFDFSSAGEFCTWARDHWRLENVPSVVAGSNPLS